MATDALTDEGLLAACRSGDERAFATLVRRHHPPLVALARCWPGEAHEAHRDVALAWLAVLGSAGSPSTALSVRARVGREVARAATRRTNLPLDAADGPLVDPGRFFPKEHELWAHEWADPPRPWGRLAARRLGQADMPRLLARRIRELGAARGAALTLRDIHGWPGAEAAAVLELSEAQVRALLGSAREALRAALEAEIDSQ